MRLSEKIKSLREKNNLTQEDLASKLYVSRQTVSKWEQEVTVPSLSTIKELALIFKVDVIELIESEIDVSTTKDPYSSRNKLLYYLNVFVVINIIMSSLILYRGMENVIPVHYDWTGNITRYGNKLEYLVIPGITFIFLSFSIYFNYILSKNTVYKKAIFGYQIWMLVLQVAILTVTIWLGFKYTSNMKEHIDPTMIGLTLSLIFSVLLFSHPKVNETKNFIFGVRTTFTLSNDEAWEKVNAVSSISGSITTLMAYVITLITFQDWNLYLLVFVATFLIPTLIYHEILKKKIKKRNLEDR